MKQNVNKVYKIKPIHTQYQRSNNELNLKLLNDLKLINLKEKKTSPLAPPYPAPFP